MVVRVTYSQCGKKFCEVVVVQALYEKLSIREIAQKSIREIAQKYGVSAEYMRRRFIELQIDRRPRGPQRKFRPPVAELEKISKRKTLKEMAKHCGVGQTVIHKRLREYQIR